jgi:hypothetical protein
MFVHVQGEQGGQGERQLMRYIVRLVVVLGLLAGVAVSAYAYFGDMSPNAQRVEQPVALGGQ